LIYKTRLICTRRVSHRESLAGRHDVGPVKTVMAVPVNGRAFLSTK
jgi:hypothetical protein